MPHFRRHRTLCFVSRTSSASYDLAVHAAVTGAAQHGSQWLHCRVRRLYDGRKPQCAQSQADFRKRARRLIRFVQGERPKTTLSILQNRSRRTRLVAESLALYLQERTDIEDAYVKGLRGGINWTDGYRAMVKDAEVIPYNTYSFDDFTASVKEGRGALKDWLELGYVSSDNSTRCISRTVEYALNDFALSQVARDIAPDDVQKYMMRSANWQRSWNHEVTSHNSTGFMTPRLANGTWNATGYNPALCGECEWKSISYEGTPWEYSFVVPHDMETLISFMGGPETFEQRLDYIVSQCS